MSKVGKLYKDRSGYICGNINSLTSKEIDELIDSILEAKAEIVEREKKEKEMEEAKKEEERKKLLEEKKIEDLTNMELPLDWSNVFDFDSEASSIHVETAGDGLIYSLKNLGRVDIEYISKITGLDMKTVINKLKNSIFQNPETFEECFYKGFETADEYLSGNLYMKLKIAEEANKKYRGHFKSNIEALTKIMPKGVNTKEIFYTISSPWIPKELIIDFIVEKFGISKYYANRSVHHDNITGTWEIRIESFFTRYGADITYGTPKLRCTKILERILNGKSMNIYNHFKTEDGTKRTLNKEETLLVEQKAKEISNAFMDFVSSSKERKEMITKAYNERYGYNVSRNFKGDFLDLPNLSKDIKLYDYQLDAVSRILFNKNTLLAHNVGAGKTYVMIAGGEELIRTGISKKNMYVVPNNIVSQWGEIYKEMYPDANLLIASEKDFVPSKRRKTLELIRSSKYKNIIISYSSFDRIPLSRSIEIKKIDDFLKEMKESKSYRLTKALERYSLKQKKILNELKDLPIDPNDDITFDKLGVERLFIDEAHNYKNIPIITKMGNIKGINPQGSDKCVHLLNIVDYMNSKGLGIIMATGTPITNSVTDAYTFQRYLQNGELKLVDINTFDDWVSMFSESCEELEVDVDTSEYRVTKRLSKFHNLPELAQILSNVADFYYEKNASSLPTFNGYTDILLKKTNDLSTYLGEISNRVDEIRHGKLNRTEDNMLKVTTDGRKAALDLRLVDYSKYSNTSSVKVLSCAENVCDIYNKTTPFKGVQLVFCDISTPKSTFNVYDELKKTLINMGVMESEIEFIHNATTDKERDKLLEKARKGIIRVLIGSTLKLGLGINVQEKLCAIHHLDVPWRPADIVQREGRIIRQGNTSEEVFIYRYIQEGSFDAYSWQLLETKQNFINELLSNSLNERTQEDIQDIVLSYGEVKALAIGDPSLKEYIDLKNQLNKYVFLQKRQMTKESLLQTQLLSIPNKVEELKEIISNLKQDIRLYVRSKRDYDEKERQDIRKRIWSGMTNNLRSEKEIDFGYYQGFRVVAPAHLLEDNLSLELRGNGVNSVTIGSSESGVMIRIDNVLNDLPNKLLKRESDLENLYEEEKSINKELMKKPDYSEKIENLKYQIVKLERILGI